MTEQKRYLILLKNSAMVRAGIPNTKRNHKYQCSVCGMELAPPDSNKKSDILL